MKYKILNNNILQKDATKLYRVQALKSFSDVKEGGIGVREMVNKEDLKYIKENLSTNDAYCQLAEEAVELAHAALKVIRAINNTNPTPKIFLEAIDTLNEEAADVFNALYVVIDDYEFIKVRDIAKRKMKRWKERLKSKDV